MVLFMDIRMYSLITNLKTYSAKTPNTKSPSQSSANDNKRSHGLALTL